MMDKTIALTLDCYRVCTEMIAYCLDMGGRHVEPSHMLLLVDCAKICQLNADFMMYGSSFHGKTCSLCADICAKCAASCEDTDPKDKKMLRCADVCRKCAEACRDMASMM